jgi:tyrosine-protein kinase Etk/Wzc
MKLAVLNQVENFVQSKENTGGIVPSTFGINDPVLSQLLDKLYSSELEYERLKTTVAENNPMLVSVKDQINKIRPSILENIQSQRQSLIASRNNINSTNSMYNSMLINHATERKTIAGHQQGTTNKKQYLFLSAAKKRRKCFVFFI